MSEVAMCMLSDVDIRQAIADGHIRLPEGFNLDRHLKGASIDLTIDVSTAVMHAPWQIGISIQKNGTINREPTLNRYPFPYSDTRFPLLLEPRDFVLVRTHESIALSNHLAARIDGRSSLARLGMLSVHAGHVNPGDEFRPMLEIANNGRLTLEIYDGAPICNVTFWWLKTPASAPYRGRYYGVGAPVV